MRTATRLHPLAGSAIRYVYNAVFFNPYFLARDDYEGFLARYEVGLIQILQGYYPYAEISIVRGNPNTTLIQVTGPLANDATLTFNTFKFITSLSETMRLAAIDLLD